MAGGRVFLTSRSGLSLEFPQIEKALSGLSDCTLDGEVVVLDEQGRSTFSDLGNGHTGAVYMAFDVVEVGVGGCRDGRPQESVRHYPIETRKELLRKLLGAADGTWVSESPVFDDGDVLLEHARGQGLEGIVAKRKGSIYQDGKRSPAWLKVKLRQEQEFVVVGWTPGKGARSGTIGALVLAVNSDDGLVYAGRCGTGAEIDSAELLADLRAIEQDTSPLLETPREEQREATWVEPTLVVQIEFQRWTPDGRLWHPSYKGRRIDKKPVDVHREPCLAC